MIFLFFGGPVVGVAIALFVLGRVGQVFGGGAILWALLAVLSLWFVGVGGVMDSEACIATSFCMFLFFVFMCLLAACIHVSENRKRTQLTDTRT